MQIKYDDSLKVAGIGLVPWSRLGPERWLPNYKIAAYRGWDIQASNGPQLILPGVELELPRANTDMLLRSADFQGQLNRQLSGYKLMTYKSVNPPESLAKFSFLSTNRALARQLENKAAFRSIMEPLSIPFPRYSLQPRRELAATDYKRLSDGQDRLVLQDEQLSGGKGTKLAQDEASFLEALSEIEQAGGGDTLVVSEFIEGAQERSLQACITKHGVLVGPMQTQIVNHPLLANLDQPASDRFCGGEIGGDDGCSAAYQTMKQYALVIGQKAQELGFRGIFGIDYLIDKSGQVYVIEMNPRITGLTPLLTMLYRDGQDIPFYLLHILELAGADYEITDFAVNSQSATGSLLILHSMAAQAGRLSAAPQSGLYDPSSLDFRGEATQLKPGSQPQLLIQRYMPTGTRIAPGGRVVAMFSNQSALTVADQLRPEAVQRVRYMTNKISLTT